MQKTISSLVHEHLNRLGKTTTEQQIKRAYHRNYQYRRGNGFLPREGTAYKITTYLLFNKIV